MNENRFFKRERNFSLGNQSENNGDLKMKTLKVGGLQEIYQEYENSGEVADFPQGALALIELFKNFSEQTRREVKTKNGVVEKRAHLLIAGGFVRDLIMGKVPRDIDFTSDLSIDELKEFLENHQIDSSLGIKKIMVDSSGIIRIKYENDEE